MAGSQGNEGPGFPSRLGQDWDNQPISHTLQHLASVPGRIVNFLFW